MSVSMAGSGHLSINQCPDYDALYTVAARIWLPSANVFKVCFSLGEASGNVSNDSLYFGSTGSRLYLESYNEGSDSAGVESTTDLSTGGWLWIALRRSVTAGATGALQGLVNGVVVVNNVEDSNRVPAATTFKIGAWPDGSNQATMWAAHARVWTASLTDNELLTEMASPTPVRTSNLWGAWELSTHTDLSDSSGNGRTLSAVGTLGTEQDPVFDQTSRPVSDVSTTGWTTNTGSGTGLATAVSDESDTTYIQSGAAPDGETVRLQLDELDWPQQGTVTIWVRHRGV